MWITGGDEIGDGVKVSLGWAGSWLWVGWG